MKIIKPSVEILTEINGTDILKTIEKVARTCYKSEDKITETDESARNMMKVLIRNDHLAMIEHYNFTVKFITDRGISHEIVRHRIASFGQESTRYCNYNKDKFNKEITVIKPSNLKEGMETYLWMNCCREAERCYFELLKEGVSPENARSVLPTCVKTEINMTTNLREWRHFLWLRCDKSAHPDIKILAMDLLKQLHNIIPIVFDDIYEKFIGGDDN